MTVLSYSYGTIMYHAINALSHGKTVVGGLNATEKRFLKGKWNIMINYQLTTNQTLGFLQVLQKMSGLKCKINLNIF